MITFLFSLCCTSLFLLRVQALIEHTRPIYGSHELVTYVVDWDLPKSIPWTKLDHIAYAFAIPDKNGQLTQFNETQLKDIVKEANQHGKGVSLAIGGWTGSIYFSSLVKNPHSRQKFSKTLVDVVDKYSLNGLNIDWEYPNDPSGISCNRKNRKDTENFLELIKLVRQKLDEKYPTEYKLITAAVSANVFLDEKRKPIKKLGQDWSHNMDAIYIMAYDINGVWGNQTAANAPLHLGETGQLVSADTSVRSWIEAGFPSERIYLGVPFYGYTHKTSSHITKETGMNVPYDRSIEQIKGDEYDSYSKDPCKGSNYTFSGEIQWRSIVKAGADSNESGWKSYWDEKTSTPYAYHSDKQQFITYDNPASLIAKTNYVKQHKLGGIMLWSLEMDDEKNSLLDSIQGVRR